MVEHEIVIGVKGNKLLNTDPQDLILKSKPLKTIFGDDAIYVPSYTRSNNTIVKSHFKSKFNGILVNGVRYNAGEGMTKEHLETQNLLSNFLDQLIEKRNYKLTEQPLDLNDKHLADVYYEFEGQKYCIEVQRSSYPDKIYKKRTEDYKNAQINICWLVIPDNINKINSRNFGYSKIMNGGYYIYLTKDNLKLDNIKKVKSDGEVITFEDTFDLSDFTNFFFNSYWGISKIEEQENIIKENESEISELRYKIQELSQDYYDKIEIFENIKKDINIQKEKSHQYFLKIYEQESKIGNNDKLLKEPMILYHKLLDKIKNLELEKEDIFKKMIEYREEFESYQKLSESLNIKENIAFLKEKGIIFEPIKKKYVLIED